MSVITLGGGGQADVVGQVRSQSPGRRRRRQLGQCLFDVSAVWWRTAAVVSRR